jgi:polyisoprenoid-binding protein YceI
MQETTKWIFDFSHSRIGFSVKHFGITDSEGLFKKFDGDISSNEKNFSDLMVNVTIAVNSIDTNDTQRDTHLKSADFLDMENFPLITFKSSIVKVVQEGQYKIFGDLTIKNVSNNCSFDLEFTGIVPKDPFGNTKAGFLLTGKINRKDWGINWNAALDHGGVAVADIVRICCPIQLLKVPV